MSEHEDFNSDPRDKECIPPEVPEIAYSDPGSDNDVGDIADQHLQAVGPESPTKPHGEGTMDERGGYEYLRDVDAIVDRMLDEGLQEMERYAQRDLLPAAGLPPSTTVWLWEGYIMRGKVTNVEAKGGSGKSRLILGIAAGLSLGVWPFTSDSATSVTCKPGKTLILTSEDTPEEITDTFK
ncbi:MAG: AAA family ATPase [Armatimonadetes bacterium]|nr:AAA family ATPase [Armatimonadota bacterium]